MQKLSCDQYDYLEIACLFGYEIKLTLHDNSVIMGKAKTVNISPDRQECLVIELDDQKQLSVVTEQIKLLNVTTANARFTRIDFSNS